MEEILSQEEIDAIFSGLKEGKTGIPDMPTRTSAHDPMPAGTILPYDFRRPDRLSREQVRTMRLLYDFFCSNLSVTLSALLRSFVQISLVSVDQIPYNEFLNYLPETTACHSISMSPLNGYSVLEISPTLAFPFVDILVGGSGSNPIPARPLTELEIDILESIVKLILKEMRETWKPIIDLDLLIYRRDTRPQMLQIVSTTESVMATGFEMKIGATISGMMNFCMPTIMLKGLKSKFAQHWSFRKQSATPASVAQVVSLIKFSKVRLAAEIRGTHVTLSDLLSLSPGDVITLEQELIKPVIVTVNDVPKYNAYIGATREIRVAQVQDAYSPS
ncbi:MAG: flagellar motor switch protein FliM [Acidobacteria bacterium]|nr:flagellar motor switch protein FliM [Acidobacteriota bacterium]